MSFGILIKDLTNPPLEVIMLKGKDLSVSGMPLEAKNLLQS